MSHADLRCRHTACAGMLFLAALFIVPDRAQAAGDAQARRAAAQALLESRNIQPSVDRLLGEVHNLNFDTVTALLDAGVDVNARGTASVSAFFMPLYHCGTRPVEVIRMLDLLAARGADVEGTDQMGNTHLLRAVQMCDAPIIGAMIDLGANPNPPPNRVGTGTTPLTMAIILSKPEVAELLVDRGARLHKGAMIGSEPSEPRMKRAVQRASGKPAKEAQAELARPPVATPEGRKRFTAYCSACHGDDGKGRSPKVPSIVGSAVVRQGKGAIKAIINEGRNLMPPGRYIPEADQDQIANYVLATFGQ